MPMRIAFAVSALVLAAVTGGPAEAVVYCKTVGVPKGCVARPAPVVVAPPPPAVVVTPAPVVVTPAPVVVTPGPAGSAVNRGGPVNRVGRR